MGIETVASTARPTGSQYLELADEAYCIGPPLKSANSYLKIDHVISAAEVGNVEAIHPGYGFLAENAHFNEVCRAARSTSSAPPPRRWTCWATRTRPRMAREAEVPVVPGSAGLIDDDAEAVRVAHEIGFPGAHQGHRRRRRQGNARGRQRPGPQVGLCSRPAPKPRPPSATRASTWKSTSSGRGTSRCRSWPTTTATWSTSGSAIAPPSAATRS
jgi:hypothetical protein